MPQTQKASRKGAKHAKDTFARLRSFHADYTPYPGATLGGGGHHYYSGSRIHDSRFTIHEPPWRYEMLLNPYTSPMTKATSP